MTIPGFEAVRQQFIASSEERLRRMSDLIAALRLDPSDQFHTEELYRHAHAFAGLGLTYGYPTVTSEATPMQNALKSIVEQASSPTVESLTEWSEIVQSIADALALPGSTSGV